MERFNFCQVFQVIDLNKVIETIESPMSFKKVSELLERYQLEGSSQKNLPPDFCTKKEFLSNHETFNRTSRKQKTFNIQEQFKLDLNKILLLKSQHLNNAAELVTIDVIDSSLFLFEFSEDLSNFSIKVTDLGKEFIFNNFHFVENSLLMYNYDLNDLY